MPERAARLTPATAQMVVEGAWKRGQPDSLGPLSFDSRRLQPGATFIALRAARDGHDFVAAAKERGATAAIVSREVDCDLPQLLVTDTLTALSDLAHWWRAFYQGSLALVTGSNGKSTTKEMLRMILTAFAGEERVIATHGNFNNSIGLPLMLLNIEPAHSYAVVEAGMNAAGEIARHTRLARPQLGIITNAGRAHLGQFRDAEGIARAKGELLGSMPTGATAVLNADDRFYPMWLEMASHLDVVSFSHAGRQATCRRIPGRDFVYVFEGSVQHNELNLQVTGEHNEKNALAAAAAAWRMGVPHESVRRGLEDFAGVPGRQEVIATEDFVLINDAYNASPESFQAAIDSLRARPETRKFLAMGDMLELGADGAQLHRDVISYAQAAGITDILAYGPLASEAAAAAGLRSCPDKQEMIAELATAMQPGDCAVLVKGSHGMHMEEVVAALLEQRP